MSDFDIYLDTDNSLAFSVDIAGAAGSSVRSQFVMEGPNGINFCFKGRSEGKEIHVEIPTLKNMISEGKYNTRLEVIIDDRVFVPLELQTELRRTVTVEAAVKTINRSQPIVTAAVINRPKIVEQTAAVLVEPEPTPTEKEEPIEVKQEPAKQEKPEPQKKAAAKKPTKTKTESAKRRPKKKAASKKLKDEEFLKLLESYDLI